MPKTRITLTLDRLLDPRERDMLRVLFNDAFGEFISQRESARDYVLKRYPEMDQAAQRRKGFEVESRLSVARAIKRSEIAVQWDVCNHTRSLKDTDTGVVACLDCGDRLEDYRR